MTDAKDTGDGDDVDSVLHTKAVRESSNHVIGKWAEVLERVGADVRTQRHGVDVVAVLAATAALIARQD